MLHIFYQGQIPGLLGHESQISYVDTIELRYKQTCVRNFSLLGPIATEKYVTGQTNRETDERHNECALKKPSLAISQN
jgi:hypothetical protein